MLKLDMGAPPPYNPPGLPSANNSILPERHFKGGRLLSRCRFQGGADSGALAESRLAMVSRAGADSGVGAYSRVGTYSGADLRAGTDSGADSWTGSES